MNADRTQRSEKSGVYVLAASSQEGPAYVLTGPECATCRAGTRPDLEIASTGVRTEGPGIPEQGLVGERLPRASQALCLLVCNMKLNITGNLRAFPAFPGDDNPHGVQCQPFLGIGEGAEARSN